MLACSLDWRWNAMEGKKKLNGENMLMLVVRNLKVFGEGIIY